LTEWYDYTYTQEGALLGNYGVEDQGYKLDASGKPKVTELIYADKQGRALNTMLPVYAMDQFQPMWYDWERELTPTTSQNVLDTKDRWDGNWKDEYSMPLVSPTSDESAEYTSIISDINTLISENVVKFITGEKPMSEYDAFIEQIKSMNIDRAIEIQQAALDRYNSRTKK
jgi:putative aldouronate transport system substrate-binding protein